MGRLKNTPKQVVENVKIPITKYSNYRNLEGELYYSFVEQYGMTEYNPLVNKIRFKLIENSMTYEDISEKINVTEERVRQTLSGKRPEKIIIDELCRVLEIDNSIEWTDFIADYDFRQKEVSHKKGHKNITYKNEFIEEFKKSYDSKTIDSYMDSLTDEEYNWGEPEETLSRFKDRKKQEIFKKLLHIYQTFPYMVEEFCDSFIYPDFFIGRYTSTPLSEPLSSAENYGILEITCIDNDAVSGSLVKSDGNKIFKKEFKHYPIDNDSFKLIFPYKDEEYNITFSFFVEGGIATIKAKGLDFGAKNIFNKR